MRPSEKCVALVKKSEGCKLKAYPDPGTGGAPWTIAYGHTRGVKPGDTCTQAQADAWLSEELNDFSEGVLALLTRPVNQGMLDALVCFAYNVGLRNLQNSTLLKLTNQGLFKEAAEQFIRWNKAAGKELPGLTTRRLAEKALYLSAEGLA